MSNFFKSSDNLALSLFCVFLKQNRVYSSFMRNLSKSSSVSDIRDFDSFNPEDYVDGAFRWSSTPEGLDYWSFLDNKWRFVVNLFKF